MGTDTYTKRSACKTAVEPSTTSDLKTALLDADLLQSEDSTLPLAIASDLVKRCTSLKNHEDELNQFKEIGSKTPVLTSEIGTDPNYKFKFVWFNTIGFVILHVIGMAGGLAALLGYCKVLTMVYAILLGYVSGLGVTMGAHRLFTHRSYKAKRWLRLVLLYMHTLAGQNCLWVWVRDHRQHHKYSDTDADPHNANRGFWFSHVGWLCVRKHPKVIEYGEKIDMSDIDADPFIMLQKKYYKVLYTIFALALPTLFPIIAWNEEPLMALWVGYFTRTIITLNITWSVNSAAHLFGTRPYDETIFPVESWFVGLFALGEGWHNYHHAFPWDYRTAEFGARFNVTCKLIDFFAKFGAIYDRKEATAAMIKNRCLRTGDMSHPTYGDPNLAPETTTLWNIFHHPLNPTYTSVEKPKIKMLPKYGYALVEEELSKRELDENILSKENELLQQKLLTETKAQNGKASYDENSNYLDTNNNITIDCLVKRNKNALNVDSSATPEVSCPGLAVSEVAYKDD